MDSKEIILARMLAGISDDYDKGVGSFFYDAEKPVAIELETLGASVDGLLDRAFADTATGTDLRRKCADQGISPKEATYAMGTVTIVGAPGAQIPQGTLVASDAIEYAINVDGTVPESGVLSLPVVCTVSGSAGNVPANAIKSFPVTVAGLTSVLNMDPITSGYDAESDESLRARYYSKVRTPATSGNPAHYRNWCLEVTGVGDARIIPIWNGAGTVKAIIINANKQPADTTLVSATAAYIETVRPIGASVTVVSAAAKAVTVSVHCTIASGYTSGQVKAAIEANLTRYLKEIAFVQNYVSYAVVGSTILATTGVIDYSGLTVNNGTVNVTVADTEVATLGGVTLV